MGLAFLAASMGVLLVCVRRTLRLAEVPDAVIVWTLALCTVCPVLLFSTTRIHIDGLAAIYLFCGVSLAGEAFQRESTGRMLLASLLLVLALNAKYTTVVVLPVLLLMQVLHLRERRGRGASGGLAGWRSFGVLMAPILLLGLQHHYRFTLEYGTPLPFALVEADVDLSQWSSFGRTVSGRTHLDMLAYLLLVFPLLLVVCLKGFYSVLARTWRERPWQALHMLVFLYLLAVLFTFQYQEMRYLAPVFPFLYVSTALAWTGSAGRPRHAISALLAASFVTMTSTAYAVTIAHPRNALIVPSLVEVVPALSRWYLGHENG